MITYGIDDSIYATKDQYDEFYHWCMKSRKSLVKYMRPRKDEWKNDREPVCNLSITSEKWLLQYCPITWVIDSIKEKYKEDDARKIIKKISIVAKSSKKIWGKRVVLK
jgi:hypothetical protein